MNRKKLYIAMVLVLPVFITVGCGGNSTRSIADENSTINENKIEQEQYQYQPEEVLSDSKESEMPMEDNNDLDSHYKLAEKQIGEKEPVVESASIESELPQPDQITIYFETNKTDVKQADYESLISHAEYLIKNSDVKLKLIGHTDQSGDVEYNENLAMKRSKSVSQVLIDYGVQAGQIITESLGEGSPLSGFEHAIYDRRVEMEYTQETQLTERL